MVCEYIYGILVITKKPQVPPEGFIESIIENGGIRIESKHRRDNLWMYRNQVTQFMG